MAVKRKSSRKKRRNRKTSKKKNSYFGFKWLLMALIIVSFLVYCFYLDHRIRTEFEGNRWRLPARVYAQATELYVGKTLNLRQLKQELLALGYLQSAYMNHPGRFQVINASTIDISTRDFLFWDAQSQQNKLRVRFSGNSISSITNKQSAKSMAITRLEPRLIGKIYPEHNEDRILIEPDQVPEPLVDALIAVEDRRFYQHRGIDPIGIARAFITNIWHMSYRQGGSTLTQQLVKNYFLTQERTLIRKFNELIMALLLEFHYSKQEILLAYLNEVYLGQNRAQAIHGFGTAAEFYFAKPLSELQHAELALLAGLVKGASFYNPRKHPERARNRRNLVLQLMLENGSINQSEYNTASKKWLGISKKPDWSGLEYTAFLDLLRQQLSQDYDVDQLRNEGLRIFTTLKPDYQSLAQQTLHQRAQQFEQTYNSLPRNSLQGGLILVSTDTAEVLAVVGGVDNKKRGYNHAINALRPVGSLIKPAVYLTALMQGNGYHPASLVDDAEIAIENKANGEIWKPKNYDKKVYGKQAMHIALAKSLNLATVNLGMSLGLEKVIATLQRLGIEKEIPAYPSLLLGASEFSVLQMTQMYQTLASGGFYTPLKSIQAVMDKQGNLLQKKPIKVKPAIDSDAVFILQSLLANVVERGTAAALKNRFTSRLPLAGKTGTTDEKRDSWFAGYGSNLLAVVWMGRDDNKPTPLTGSSGALQVWADVMSQLPLEPLNMTTPDGVVWHRVAVDMNGCQNSFPLPFLKQQPPDKLDICD